MNPNLNNIKCIKSQVKLDWHENILTTDSAIVHIRAEYGTLWRYIYDNNLSKFIQNINTAINDKDDLLMSDNCYIVKDGNSIRMTVEYKSLFNYGIKQKRIALYGNKIEESCVYSYIPYEDDVSDEEYRKKTFYMSPNNKGSWTVFIKDDDLLRIANVK